MAGLAPGAELRAALGQEAASNVEDGNRSQPRTGPGAWSADELRRVGYAVVDEIAGMLSGAGAAAERVFEPVPKETRERLLTSPWGAEGVPPEQLLEEFRELIEPYPLGNGN